MTQSILVEESRVVPIPADEAFHRTLPAPLPDIFKRWHGPFPPIREVRDQTGAWDAAGQTRNVRLAGGSLREELTNVDPPTSFGYRLGDVKGLGTTLEGAKDKLAQMDAQTARTRQSIYLGMPSFGEIAARA